MTSCCDVRYPVSSPPILILPSTNVLLLRIRTDSHTGNQPLTPPGWVEVIQTRSRGEDTFSRQIYRRGTCVGSEIYEQRLIKIVSSVCTYATRRQKTSNTSTMYVGRYEIELYFLPRYHMFVGTRRWQSVQRLSVVSNKIIYHVTDFENKNRRKGLESVCPERSESGTEARERRTKFTLLCAHALSSDIGPFELRTERMILALGREDGSRVLPVLSSWFFRQRQATGGVSHLERSQFCCGTHT